MKKQILKIAGVKSEKEFYKKYPTEEAFMKEHGKAFKKAQIGAYIGGEKDAGFQPISLGELKDPYDLAITGSTEAMRQEEAYKQAQLAAAQQDQEGGSGPLGGLGGMMNFLGSEEGKELLGSFGGGGADAAGAAGAMAGAKRGKKIKKAQGGAATQPEPQQIDYPDYNSWKADWDLWNSNQSYQGMGKGTGGTGATPAPSSIPNPTFAYDPGKEKHWTEVVGKYAGPTGKIIEGFGQLKKEKEARRLAEQTRDVSFLMRDAAATSPEETKRRYLRSEDVVNTGEEFFPIYGVGTNPLAKDGKMIGGIPGEIANTFAPNTLYDNLGYEPLNDSERYKQFYHGGKMYKAQDGGGVPWGMISNKASGYATELMGGQNAGGQIGGGIGGAVGSIFGPAGQAVGEFVGTIGGQLLDRNPARMKNANQATQRNISGMAMQSGIQGMQGQHTSYMEDGGTTSPYAWMSHTWQPQVIASFGGHNVKDLLKPPHDADMLRAGGHLKAYTPPSAAAMSTERPMMQMGGELETHWGGYAEPMSYNPYLPDGGETIMFRGQSHDESDGRGNTGIGITYGENPVEVERGEPAIKMKDGGSPGDSSLVVFGNLKIPKAYIPMLGEEANGKKFKTYVADLSKKENKQNKKIDKATGMLEDFEVSTPIDKITLNSLQYTMLGANEKLKDLADKKVKAASLQNAINDTAEEYGLIADDLARGKVKIDKKAMKEVAEFGKLIKAQNGRSNQSKRAQLKINQNQTLNKVSALPTVPTGQQKGEVFWGNVTQTDFDEMKTKNPWYDWANFDPSSKADVEDFQIAFNREAEKLGVPTRLRVDGALGEQTASAKSLYGNAPSTVSVRQLNLKEYTPGQPVTPTSSNVEIPPYERSGLMDVIGQAMPYLRPSDVEDLDMRQLMGEMYALSTNQLEPVQAQTIQPQLSVPYDISYQDILNENEAAYRSQQRMVGYNPALQSQLNAQKYAANQKVLAEQFRANQAMKDSVYRENRNLLNQYGLKNLEILDRQYVRQAEAKSKTKAITQAALNSISDKYLRNQLENRTLAVMENLYNFRYDPRFRTMNVNAPYQPQIPTVYVGPDGKQYQVMTPGTTGAPNAQIPSMATPPIIPPGRVPAAAPSATQVQPLIPITDQELNSQMLTAEEIEEQYKRGGRKGINVKKKNSLNSSVVKAFKNL